MAMVLETSTWNLLFLYVSRDDRHVRIYVGTAQRERSTSQSIARGCVYAWFHGINCWCPLPICWQVLSSSSFRRPWSWCFIVLFIKSSLGIIGTVSYSFAPLVHLRRFLWDVDWECIIQAGLSTKDFDWDLYIHDYELLAGMMGSQSIKYWLMSMFHC